MLIVIQLRLRLCDDEVLQVVGYPTLRTLSADCISVAICATWTSLVILPDCVSSGPSVFFFFAVGLVSASSLSMWSFPGKCR